jgi:hypothetical protein
VDEAHQLQAEFDRLFAVSADPSVYTQLEERKALTRAKKDARLLVLTHPEISLHNNPAELDIVSISKGGKKGRVGRKAKRKTEDSLRGTVQLRSKTMPQGVFITYEYNSFHR